MNDRRIGEIVDEVLMEQDAKAYREMREVLKIPKSIAVKIDNYFDKDEPNSFERSTRFVFQKWSRYIKAGDTLDPKEFNKRIQIVGAYLNPLTRDLVKVVDDDRWEGNID